MLRKALLDTNIIIHREAACAVSRDIGNLYRWLDKLRYEKCIHPVTINEISKNINPATVDTFRVKMQSYTQLQQVAGLMAEVRTAISPGDRDDHDRNDTTLVNELYAGRVDILISEDKGILSKARLLGVENKVFTITSFLEKCVAENPDQIDYKVLNVKRRAFGSIPLKDIFFDSLKEDYPGFEKWFNAKSEEKAYVTTYRDNVLSFLYLKVETEDEPYPNITPQFPAKRRLKVGTFKVLATGFRLGERFLKIIFDNAIRQNVNEIYVTIKDTRDEQKRLIELLRKWGFAYWGVKSSSAGVEKVYVRDMAKRFDPAYPERTFPYFPTTNPVYLVPIWPEYHTNLLPDSILCNEDAEDFQDSEPHRNAITKVYVSHALDRKYNRGDIIVFYRTGGYYKSVVTTIGIVTNVFANFSGSSDFIAQCRKNSVFTDKELMEYWNRYTRLKPFIIEFLCAYSFRKRPNLARLIKCGVIKDSSSAPRYPTLITRDKFLTILKEAETDESIVVC